VQEVVFIFCIHSIHVVTIIVQWKQPYCSLWGCHYKHACVYCRHQWVCVCRCRRVRRQRRLYQHSRQLPVSLRWRLWRQRLHAVYRYVRYTRWYSRGGSVCAVSGWVIVCGCLSVRRGRVWGGSGDVPLSRRLLQSTRQLRVRMWAGLQRRWTDLRRSVAASRNTARTLDTSICGAGYNGR